MAAEVPEMSNWEGEQINVGTADGDLSVGQEAGLESNLSVEAKVGEVQEPAGVAPRHENGLTPKGGTQHPENAPPAGEALGSTHRPPGFDLNESHQPEEPPAGTGELGGFDPMQEDGAFENAPNGRDNGLGGGLPGLAELNPDWGVDEALGFFPDEELPQEQENVVLAAKRAEVQTVERKMRVLEKKRDAWMRAFEKKRAQYEARMANVESVCRARELAQEEQRKVVYQEKWALEAARQAAAQLLQDLLTLVPSPDGVSLDRLHPQMTWETTFGPQCVIRRQIVEQHFQKQQRAVSMLQAAALDAHRKKLAMSKKLGLDVRDEELTGGRF